MSGLLYRYFERQPDTFSLLLIIPPFPRHPTDTLSTLANTLNRVMLDDNNLERFPTVLLSLTKLTDLSIGGNPLEEIPMGISALTNLDSFNAKDCRLVTVPKARLFFF